MEASINHYKEVLKQDATNIEAIACIGTNYFYSDQPEIALRYYRLALCLSLSFFSLFSANLERKR